MTTKAIKKFSIIILISIFAICATVSCGSAEEPQTVEIAFEDEAVQEQQSVEGILVDMPISDMPMAEKKNTYNTLNVATYITKADNTYFIADCYHDRIIFSDTLTEPLTEWSVLTDEVHYAHTIASDGLMLLIDDTENNRLLAFQRTDEGYVHTQTLENIGMKPHFVQYNEKQQVFMAWSSITGEMYLIKRYSMPNEQGVYPLYIEKVLKIEELYGVYVRSFTIIDDEIYFVSGHNNQKIIKAAINDSSDAFEILAEYSVPDALAGMVQLYKIQDYYYITVSTDNTENQDYATIIRTKSPGSLKTGDYEDIYAQFGLSGGTPYYINEIEGRYYMTHHRTGENIIAFDVNNNTIENIQIIF